MSHSITLRRLGVHTGALLLALVMAEPLQAAIDPTCIDPGPTGTKSGSELNSFTPTRSGVIYDGNSASLKLTRTATFQSPEVLGLSDTFSLTCAGDFDQDGWTDFIGVADGTDYAIRWYKNQTYENPAPGCAVGGTAADPNPGCATPWTPVTGKRDDKFVRQTPDFDTRPGAGGAIRGGVACGDINKDGRMDFVLVVCDSGNLPNDYCSSPTVSTYLNTGNASAPFSSSSPYKYASMSSTSALGRVTFFHQFIIADVTGDNWPDMVWGGGTTSGSMTSKGGDVSVFVSDAAASQPKFSATATVWLPDAGYNFRGPAVLALADFDLDGTKELLVTGQSTNRVRLYPLPLSATSYETVTYNPGGGAQVALVADFSLDGRPDLIFGTDNWNYPSTSGYDSTQHVGGVTSYYKNDGDDQPFSTGLTQTMTSHDDSSPLHAGGKLYDFDLGIVLDYDKDPDSTPDFIIADGNHAGTFFLVPNRPLSTFPACGQVTSDPVDIGSLATTEMTVTAARITPTPTTPPAGTSTSWEASNDNGASFWPAVNCTTAPTTDMCVTFTSTVGKQLRWRATLYSNTSKSCGAGSGTATPNLTSVGLSFTYVTAENHFRAGPVAKDGLIYLGAFKEPGSRGKLFAINDNDAPTVAWEAGAQLDAMSDSSRTLFVGTSGTTKVAWTTAQSGNSTIQAALGTVGSSTATGAVIGWQRAARFGLTGTKTRMGGVENSTVAVMDEPKQPYFYGFAATTATERTAIDAYVDAYKTRKNLVFVGSRDGVLHAIYTNPDSPTDAQNGAEIWGYVPYDVAQRMQADCTSASTASPKVCVAGNGSGEPAAYPDGSPTLASAKINGAWKTVLVMGEGNGGKSVFALDVTDTYNPSTGVASGPTPLWTFTSTNMGRTYSKPTIIRTKVSGVEKWMAVFASGPGLGVDVGDSVYAVDLTTGALAWQFDLGDTNVYVATDITSVETDDVLEANGPTKDGFIDRLFFADTKGRVWKLDPADGSIIGSNASSGITGKNALFSTKYTTSPDNVINAERAIAGTLAAGEDGTGRLVLYFGTGGTDDTPDNVQNQFFAVYADDGSIRSPAITPAVGVKFYGGVVLNGAGQLIFSTGQNLEGLGLCATSAGEIVAVNANTFAQDFVITTSGKLVAPIYAQGGMIYTVNVKGEMQASQYVPPGSISTSGGSGGSGSGSGTGSGAAVEGQGMDIVSWRQVEN